MDVVGEHVILGRQHRVAALQTVERQAVGGVDARRTQHADTHPATATEGAQLAFGIDTATSPCGAGTTRPRFVHEGALAIAVNPCRTYVYQALW